MAGHEAALHAELSPACASARRAPARQPAVRPGQLRASTACIAADLAHLLAEQGIAVRHGHHCAQPLLTASACLGRAGSPSACTTMARTWRGCSAPSTTPWHCCNRALCPTPRKPPLSSSTRRPAGSSAPACYSQWGSAWRRSVTPNAARPTRCKAAAARSGWLPTAPPVPDSGAPTATPGLLRGLLAVLLVRVNTLPANELAQLDIADWFNQLGLQRQLYALAQQRPACRAATHP